MTIDLRKTKEIKNQKIEKFFQKSDSKPQELEAPRDLLLEQYSRDALLHWRAPEFERDEWNKKWYLIAALILAAIIIYSLVSNNPITAIVFILIGIVGYLHLQKKPRVLDFMINYEGIIAGQEIYLFKEMKSFWIFYEPHIKTISLQMKDKVIPHIHIPVGNEDPVKIREVLLRFLPEKEQDLTLVDIVEKVLRL